MPVNLSAYYGEREKESHLIYLLFFLFFNSFLASGYRELNGFGRETKHIISLNI